MSQEGPAPKGKLVGFKPLQERFAYYSLDDGTVLGVKPVMVKVFRVIGPDGKPATAPDGSPAYFYQTQNVTQILTPDEYKTMKDRERME
jgi:hypothetical protein